MKMNCFVQSSRGLILLLETEIDKFNSEFSCTFFGVYECKCLLFHAADPVNFTEVVLASSKI